MPDRQGPDAWLIGANKAWQERADEAERRAVAAERWADRERMHAADARQSARYWRHMAVIAWAWLTVELAESSWHWSRWSALVFVPLAACVNGVVDYVQIRRRKAASR